MRMELREFIEEAERERLTIPRHHPPSGGYPLFETDEQAEFEAECARLTPRQLQQRLASEYAEEQLLVVQQCEAHQAVREAERRRGALSQACQAHQAVREAERRRGALSQACQAQRARIRLLLAEVEGRKP